MDSHSANRDTRTVIGPIRVEMDVWMGGITDLGPGGMVGGHVYAAVSVTNTRGLNPTWLASLVKRAHL